MTPRSQSREPASRQSPQAVADDDVVPAEAERTTTDAPSSMRNAGRSVRPRPRRIIIIGTAAGAGGGSTRRRGPSRRAAIAALLELDGPGNGQECTCVPPVCGRRLVLGRA